MPNHQLMTLFDILYKLDELPDCKKNVGRKWLTKMLPTDFFFKYLAFDYNFNRLFVMTMYLDDPHKHFRLLLSDIVHPSLKTHPRLVDLDLERIGLQEPLFNFLSDWLNDFRNIQRIIIRYIFPDEWHWVAYIIESTKFAGECKEEWGRGDSGRIFQIENEYPISSGQNFICVCLHAFFLLAMLFSAQAQMLLSEIQISQKLALPYLTKRYLKC